MPDNKKNFNKAIIENWRSYLKVHGTGGNYRLLNAKELEQEIQENVRSKERFMQRIGDAFIEISLHYVGRVAHGSTERIIDQPKYRAIAYEEIIKCVSGWDGERIIWSDPVKGGEYEKNGDTFIKAGQYIFENFLEETFYQYTVTKAIHAGQSLKDKEKILKRQVDRDQRLGKKPPLKKYNVVKQIRQISTKQGGYVTKFLEYYNKPFIALPLAAWTNVFSLNSTTLPEEADFRNSIRELMSQYINKTLPTLKHYPLWYKFYKEDKKQTNPK